MRWVFLLSLYSAHSVQPVSSNQRKLDFSDVDDGDATVHGAGS